VSRVGIDIRGRGRKLRVNYRTTDEIRKWAVAQLANCAIDDLDGQPDLLVGYLSLAARLRRSQSARHGSKSNRVSTRLCGNWMPMVCRPETSVWWSEPTKRPPSMRNGCNLPGQMGPLDQ
jgi:hypothetical protein